jgi:ABC-type nickel/cobalt efflux system permease component RcnA
MNSFELFFHSGWKHIADLNALDHIIFLIALCLRYQFSDWKKLLILITAFTIGNAITLTLCVLNVLSFSSRWIEFLIALLILITAINNLSQKKTAARGNPTLLYLLSLFFGCLHGFGYGNYLKSAVGIRDSLFIKLLGFNIGVEAGQILVVLVVLLLTLLCLNLLKFNRRDYILFVSGAIFGIALQMTLHRLPF